VLIAVRGGRGTLGLIIALIYMFINAVVVSFTTAYLYTISSDFNVS